MAEEIQPIRVDEALDRVLAEDVLATADIPPFANSAMDGYALQSGDVTAASPDTPGDYEQAVGQNPL